MNEIIDIVLRIRSDFEESILKLLFTIFAPNGSVPCPGVLTICGTDWRSCKHIRLLAKRSRVRASSGMPCAVL